MGSTAGRGAESLRRAAPDWRRNTMATSPARSGEGWLRELAQGSKLQEPGETLTMGERAECELSAHIRASRANGRPFSLNRGARRPSRALSGLRAHDESID